MKLLWTRMVSMKTKGADQILGAMKAGSVYRRDQLAMFSKAVDRDLKELLQDGRIGKAAPGLYYRSKQSRFGPVPPEQRELVRAFLKTDDFLLTSLNVYNSLGLGLTQLSNEMLVYNRKRVGRFKLGGLVYNFKRPVNFPKKISEEFLIVDLLNNYDELAEPPNDLWQVLRDKVQNLSPIKLRQIASVYGKVRTVKMLNELLSYEQAPLAA